MRDDKPTTLRPGDRIGYAVRFLRSIGCYEYDVANRRGTIVEVCPVSPGGGSVEVVRIRWDDEPEELERALPRNVARLDSAAWRD